MCATVSSLGTARIGCVASQSPVGSPVGRRSKVDLAFEPRDTRTASWFAMISGDGELLSRISGLRDSSGVSGSAG